VCVRERERERERETTCSVVGTLAWRNVSCEDGILWHRKWRHLLWKCHANAK